MNIAFLLVFVVLSCCEYKCGVDPSVFDPLDVVSGVENMRYGFNDVMGNSSLVLGFPLEGVPLYEFTYIKNCVWISPKDPIWMYKVPDQIRVDDEYEQEDRFQPNPSRSYYVFMHPWVDDWNRGPPQPGYFFAANGFNPHIGRAYELLNGSSQYYSEHAIHRIDVIEMNQEKLPFTDQFIEDAKSLPENIETYDDIYAYFEFSGVYGTHYLTHGHFGGYAMQDTFTDKTKLKNPSDFSWVQRYTEKMFHFNFFNVSSGGYRRKGDIYIDPNFLEATEVYTYFIGGRPDLQSPDSLSLWADSVMNEFYMTRASTELISLCLPSPQKENMEILVKAYLASGTWPWPY